MEYLAIDNRYKVYLNASASTDWDMTFGKRVFHISQEEEAWLLQKLLCEYDIITLPDVRTLNFTGPKWKDLNALEFTLVFLQAHTCDYNGERVSSDKIYVSEGGWSTLYEDGMHHTKKDRAIGFVFYCMVASILLFIEAFLCGAQVSLSGWEIPLVVAVTIGSGYFIRRDLRYYEQFASQFVVFTAIIIFGLIFRVDNDPPLLLGLIGGLSYGISVLAVAIGVFLSVLAAFNSGLDFLTED